MKVNRLILFCILFLLMLGGCRYNISQGHREEKILSLSKAIEIGKDELRRVGYSYWNKELLAKADNDNTVWKNHVDSSPSVMDNEAIKQMGLEDKDYWAIYYIPKNFSGKGGDAFVFIDRSNGKVLGSLLGE